MAQQTCLDARVCVFLQALDFLHQSNYIKKGGFHTVLSYYMQLNCAWMCNHSRWGVPSNSTINYAELCLKLCPMSIHLLLLCPEDASKFLPRSSVFVGWRMTGGRIWMTHDIMMTDDDWPSCFFPLFYRCCHWYTVDRRMLKQEIIFWSNHPYSNW